MTIRELGMTELEKRCKPLINSIPLKKVLRLPDRQIDSSDMPCILIMEGEDKINKRSSRGFLGYPLMRSLSVIVECWDHSSGNVENIKKEALEAIQFNSGVLIDQVLIREEKTIGPFNLGVPRILGIRIVFEMSYIDNGL